jgi:ABC-type glycerol-3-phosphate transport system substrate-binding protein
MRRSLFARVSLALVIAGLSLAPASLAGTRAAAGQTVTMYAYEWTPSTGAPTAAHPLVYHALQVLADKFKSETGITIKFIPPVCVSVIQACLNQTHTYLETQVAANTAPDVMLVHNGTMEGATTYWMNLNPYLMAPDPYNTAVKNWCLNFAASISSPPALAKGTTTLTCYAADRNGKQQPYDVMLAGSYPGLLIGEMANVNLLKQAGVTPTIPTDWSDWLKQLAAIKAKGINAMSGETSHSGAQASSWPFWSALWPAYMGHALKEADPTAVLGSLKPADNPTTRQVAEAYATGKINTSDPMMQAVFLQVKKYMSYWVNGWQTSDVEALWTQGQLAERQFYIADLFGEYSNPARKFNMTIGFPPYPTKKTDPGVMTPFGSFPTGTAARLARVSTCEGCSFGLITSSVTRDNNVAAAIKWLQFITAPAQDQYIINEHPDYIPVTVGATMAPLYASLNNTPIPDWRNLAGTYFGGLTSDATPNLEKELAVWVTGHETDAQFFANMEKQLVADGQGWLAANKS